MGEVEAGHGCPISMTYAAIPALRVDAEGTRDWVQGLTSRGVRLRTARTTEQDGLDRGYGHDREARRPDVRTNTTVATPTDDGYLLTGHKWFCSAPMSDVFLSSRRRPAG